MRPPNVINVLICLAPVMVKILCESILKLQRKDSIFKTVSEYAVLTILLHLSVHLHFCRRCLRVAVSDLRCKRLPYENRSVSPK